MPKYPTLKTLADKLADDEPVFPLRAQDALAPAAVEAYALALEIAAVTVVLPSMRDRLLKQAEDVRRVSTQMRNWQAVNASRVKLPD